ncbi:MAG: PEP-CTERM sorting domain-containing protein [Colwellia sp.]|nr:PEP-CTERM sorting domain-containing protein [Colwellia sp.]
MIKFISVFLLVVVVSISNAAHAGIISADIDLSEDAYTTVGGLDWTWASSINVGTRDSNTFEDASFRALFGWRTLLPEELLILKNDLTIDEHFKNIDGSIIQSLQYWNTDLTVLIADDIQNFNDNLIKGAIDNSFPNQIFQWHFETFYVRNTPSQVPEPSTIMIFAIALIVLSMRKRLAK